MGSQALNELSLQRDIRVLGVPDAVLDSQDWADFLVEQAQFESVVPAETYSGQVNGDRDLTTTASAMMMSVTADMEDDTAYTLTKAYWDNLDAMKNTNALMRAIDASKPFDGMNAKLHPGAVRYCQEAGIEIPEALLP